MFDDGNDRGNEEGQRQWRLIRKSRRKGRDRGKDDKARCPSRHCLPSMASTGSRRRFRTLVTHLVHLKGDTKEDNALEALLDEGTNERLELVDAPALLAGKRRDDSLSIGVVCDEDGVHEHVLGEGTALVLVRPHQGVVHASMEDGAGRREPRVGEGDLDSVSQPETDSSPYRTGSMGSESSWECNVPDLKRRGLELDCQYTPARHRPSHTHRLGHVRGMWIIVKEKSRRKLSKVESQCRQPAIPSAGRQLRLAD